MTSLFTNCCGYLKGQSVTLAKKNQLWVFKDWYTPHSIARGPYSYTPHSIAYSCKFREISCDEIFLASLFCSDLETRYWSQGNLLFSRPRKDQLKFERIFGEISAFSSACLYDTRKSSRLPSYLSLWGGEDISGFSQIRIDRGKQIITI